MKKAVWILQFLILINCSPKEAEKYNDTSLPIVDIHRSPVTTNRYLYYLYLGVSPDDANTDEILKLDWNGGFESGYKLDEEIVIFTVHNGKIYAIDEFWEKIIVYELRSS